MLYKYAEIYCFAKNVHFFLELEMKNCRNLTLTE